MFSISRVRAATIEVTVSPPPADRGEGTAAYRGDPQTSVRRVTSVRHATLPVMTPKRSSWAFGPMLGFDLETWGVDVEHHQAVTISLVECRPGREPVPHEWLVSPGEHEIPAEATKIHKITTEYARKHGMPPAEAWGQVQDLLREHWTPEVPLVAYNLHFDLTMGDRELARHCGSAMPIAGRFAIDPIVIGRANDTRVRGAGKWKLEATCQRYGVRLENAHNSTADTIATVRLAYKMASMWQGAVGYVSLPDLHVRQVEWNRAWCTGMHDWLIGKALELERAWLSNNHGFVAQKLAGAGVEGAPSNETVEAACASTRAKALDFLSGANGWPMRVRPVALAEATVSAEMA